MMEYTQYVDPKYAEQLMAESLSLDEDLPSRRCRARDPASETAEPEAEPVATEGGK